MTGRIPGTIDRVAVPLLLGMCLVAIGCDQTRESSSGHDWPAQWTLSQAPILSIGEVEGESAFLLTNVNHATLLADGRVAIADAGSHEVRVFERTGEVSWIAGGSGDGPGEFQQLGWIRELPGGEIAAYDFGAFRLSVFDAQGNHRATSALDFSRAGGLAPVQGLLDNGTFLLRDIEGRTWTRETIPPFGVYRVPIAYVFLTDGTVDTIHTSEGGESFIISEGPRVWFGGRPMGPEEVVTTGDSFAVVGLSTDPFLLLLREDGEVDTVSVPLPERLNAPQWEEDFKTHFLGELWENDVDQGLRVLAETEPPPRLPYIDRVEVDFAGRLWLREYGFAENLKNWFVVSTRGEAIARIAIADSVRVLDVADSVLVGRTEDDLGVQRIHLWRIIR